MTVDKLYKIMEEKHEDSKPRTPWLAENSEEYNRRN